ncbi:hypothetical protein [Streptomyces sp. NPDC002520]
MKDPDEEEHRKSSRDNAAQHLGVGLHALRQRLRPADRDRDRDRE